MGSNLDYLRQTVAHLDELGIVDGPLHRLLRIAEEAAAAP
jgi:cation transport regulator ChaC